MCSIGADLEISLRCIQDMVAVYLQIIEGDAVNISHGIIAFDIACMIVLPIIIDIMENDVPDRAARTLGPPVVLDPESHQVAVGEIFDAAIFDGNITDRHAIAVGDAKDTPVILTRVFALQEITIGDQDV